MLTHGKNHFSALFGCPPYLDKFSFGASGECSFKFSPGNAIVLLIYTLFKYRKIKKDIEKIRKAGK